MGPGEGRVRSGARPGVAPGGKNGSDHDPRGRIRGETCRLRCRALAPEPGPGRSGGIRLRIVRGAGVPRTRGRGGAARQPRSRSPRAGMRPLVAAEPARPGIVPARVLPEKGMDGTVRGGEPHQEAGAMMINETNAEHYR